MWNRVDGENRDGKQVTPGKFREVSSNLLLKSCYSPNFPDNTLIVLVGPFECSNVN